MSVFDQLLQQGVVPGPDLAQEQRVDQACGLDETGQRLPVAVAQLGQIGGDVDRREACGHFQQRGPIRYGRGFLHETFSGDPGRIDRAHERDDSNQDLRFHVFAKHGSLAR